MAEAQELSCTRCGSVVLVRGGEWIDAELYECELCRKGESPLQSSFLPGREEWHGGSYDPTMAAIPF